MSYLFAPGCALLIDNPDLAKTAHRVLESIHGEMERLLTCCRHTPPIPSGTTVINVCPGCDRRYRLDYAEPSTVSLWEILATSDSFPFPNYDGITMTIIDACPTRDQDRIHDAMRTLASRMNIDLIEPERTRRNSTCCGDSFYGALPTGKVVEQIQRKASEMPADDIIVYCVSCVKAMLVGGRRPRYMLDLLFGQATTPGVFEPDSWHSELDAFIEAHTGFETSR